MQPFKERGAQVTRLEAFVDAAFAFAITLMAVAGESIPDSVEALSNAMKGIPAFALAFALILRFWSAHADWSRAYGLDDAVSVRLSLLLVMLLLIFVYPVRMVFAALFNFLSDGWLPAGFAITEVAQLPVLFITFAAAFGSMGAVMWALHLRAWQLRERLQLDPRERLWTRVRLWNWGLVPVVAVVSVLLALSIPATAHSGWLLGLPGFVFFTINLAEVGFRLWLRRRLHALEAPA
ncbi:TMEM175 family protein [uncultured Aquimonas sp.]|uniref:TMEM175 family protein n=1 Tax=uncultured Aquimonas sp. TaxID=385483 RepID=UPI00086B0915|nr:TMEM175 family protein [uncultured Aquimonas sp.]ODU46175.1 MAG: hypothetical protein ABS96_09705 [Xanthomonadaceae bacterium SCN 69-123]